MSTNTYKMWRSWELVVSEFFRNRPEYREEVEKHRDMMQLGWFYRSLQVRSYRNALFFYKELRRRHVVSAPNLLHRSARSILRDFSEWATFGLTRRKPTGQVSDHYLALDW